MKFLTVQQPKVAERDILDHLQRAYGLPGSLKRLEGERDIQRLHMIVKTRRTLPPPPKPVSPLISFWNFEI